MGDIGLSEEDDLLQQALAMSMNENDPTEQKSDSTENAGKESSAVTDGDDDAAMQMALQMSMQTEKDDQSSGQQFQDPQFVNQLLGSLPGVDPNDPQIQNALRNVTKEDEENSKEDHKDK